MSWTAERLFKEKPLSCSYTHRPFCITFMAKRSIFAILSHKKLLFRIMRRNWIEISFRWPTTNIHRKLHVMYIGRRLRTYLRLLWRLDSRSMSRRKNLKSHEDIWLCSPKLASRCNVGNIAIFVRKDSIIEKTIRNLNCGICEYCILESTAKREATAQEQKGKARQESWMVL
jgi:hypothetical protein